MKKGKVLTTFVAGAAIGAGLGILLAPKAGSETRKDLKKKIDELMDQVKKMDKEDVKKKFDKKVSEIKEELSDLDKEKVLAIAKEKGEQAKIKAQELVDLAKEKGTPVLKKSAESVLESVIKASKEALKKLESEEE